MPAHPPSDFPLSADPEASPTLASKSSMSKSSLARTLSLSGQPSAPPRNALQAVLDRAMQTPEPSRQTAPVDGHEKTEERMRKEKTPLKAYQASSHAPSAKAPSRMHTQLIAGHFPRHVGKQLKMIALEEDTTLQALLEEALNLLFIKKGKQKIRDLLHPLDM
jgi:hypothetical protein